MTFEAKKDRFFTILFYTLFLILGIAILEIFQSNSPAKWFLLMFVLLVLLFIIWSWYSTFYTINGIVLEISSGPLNKRIPIRNICKIEVGKTMWAGYKLGLSLNGIIIHYNKYDEIYISPQDVNKFIAEVKKVNKDLVVISPTT
ncbi:MAG TPA: hypothetical protein EYG85_12075 [Crocinitomix sp.]|nr:hypothetical protein [Crocinitomix sp.]